MMTGRKDPLKETVKEMETVHEYVMVGKTVLRLCNKL